jgi:peptidoglycan lytic transglycosylase G
MKRTLLLKAILPAVIVAAICTFLILEYQRFFNQPLALDNAISYTVAPGSSLKSISEDLKQQGLTDLPPIYLQLYGRLTDQARQIKAGEYLITAETTLPELLEKLVSGKVIMNTFTIIEGMTAHEMLKALHAHPKIVKTRDTVSLEAVMAALGKPEQNGEGWFLPETYYFPSGTTDIAFLQRAYEQMQQTLEQAWARRAENLPYKSPYEVLIMASIIEKETGIAEERPEIAGVFVRRLQKGMRLQTDPTVIYGLGDKFDGNLRKKDLLTDTPYNTYTRAGLPPSPICLPSVESIEAALHPADGDSLYFVATGKEGRHKFSATLQEHNRAVRRYQLKQ